MQKLIDWLVPWELILMVIIVLGKIIFVLPFYWWVVFYVLLGLVLLDLLLKLVKVSNVKGFVSSYLFEVIVLLPFYLVFRVLERFMVLVEREDDKKTFNMLFHDNLNKKETKIIKVCEKRVGRRVRSMTRFFKPIQKNHRLLIALTFYEEVR